MSLRPVLPALFAAVLFGASTPLAKWLGTGRSPLLVAGLLYLGSGAGLALALATRRAWRRRDLAASPSASVPRADVPWLVGAIVAGGVLAPASLMAGLQTTGAASASLLLNLEGVLTAVLAWVVFKENADRRIVLGMVSICAGGLLLVWEPGSLAVSSGSLLVAAACVAWAVDNNLTRKVSANDAMFVACTKGLAAGACNTGLALASGADVPSLAAAFAVMIVGFGGYGLSLVLFVVALRTLGTARTGAYFSVAPLFGVLVAFAIWPETPHWTFWGAAALMGIGVWLHLRERHVHDHVHPGMEHAHPHVHDAHHDHEHDFPIDRDTPHSHPHRHGTLAHRHAHYPDIHHRHPHERSSTPGRR